MTKVLLIGNGAREHAIAAALARSDVEILAHMDKMNPGIASLASETSINTLMDSRKLPDTTGIDYAVVGPEGPLSVGVVDYLISKGIQCIGAVQEAARIETNKSFARRILDDVAKIANPKYVAARSVDALKKFEDSVGVENVVVKPDGLSGGKGVKIFGDHFDNRDDLEKYAITLLSKHGIVILEEKLIGTEFTVQAFVDGTSLELMPLVRDYKRAYDDDKGPNTGSMGSYSKANHMLGYVTDEDLTTASDIMLKTVIGIKKRTKLDYKGILYGQFMKTDKGIKVIEFNARFGDPEAMNVLSLLTTSLDDVFQSIIDGQVIKPDFEKKATVCLYIVPDGYPGPDVAQDSPISLIPGIDSEVYYASVYDQEGVMHTTGSRALGLLAKGDTVEEARSIVYKDAERVNGKIRFRSDIAKGVEE
ncbi:MAG: phosphoribosylamine--glycine ligase [Candidatus Thorarchaeota archaeon]|nr:phosphoribosylamine--glycine ligase [Candidatus Thorarchaeota archaeon]